MSSRSSATLVLPSPPGGTEPRPNTFDGEVAVAGDLERVASGRTPLVLEFSTVRRIGCCDVLELRPSAGSSSARRGDVHAGNGAGDRGAQRRFALLRFAPGERERPKQAATTAARAEELVRMVRYPVRPDRGARGAAANAGGQPPAGSRTQSNYRHRAAKDCRAGRSEAGSSERRARAYERRQEAAPGQTRLHAAPAQSARRSARKSDLVAQCRAQELACLRRSPTRVG